MNTQEKLKDLVEQCVSSIISMFSEAISKGSFTLAVQETKSLTDNLGVNILETLCRKADKIYNDTRDKHQVTIKDKSKTRHLITELGEVTLERICYFDKRSGKRFFAVDEMLGLEKRSRVEQGLQAKLIEEADEDHIHLQNGKSAEVKLVYVHDGVKTICKDRTQLQNVRYFVSVDDDPDKIWNDVAHYVYRKYSMLNAKAHISGDGAYWIKYGQHIFHKAQYHIDKFHIQKSATAVAKGNRQVRSKILAAMRKRDYKSLKTVFQEQYLKYTERTERRTIAEQYFYLLNNMETYGIKNRCSAEGHVSHVLSDRMSSRPMGWSRAGAEQMAKLRAFYFNGGNFLDLIRYGKIAEDDMQEIYTTRYNSHVNAVKLGVAPTPAKVYSVASIAGQNTRISKLLRSLIKIK